MADLRIVDTPEIPTENITGEEKLPTGGNGNYSISLDSLADYTKTKKDLADNTSVDNKVNGVRQELDAHIEDLLNPHQVTKGQIGLGNVDNTADADKPVSNSTQATIISAVAPKTDKTYVDNRLTLKANKVDVYTKAETYTKQESSDLVSSSISTALTPVNSSLDLAKRGVANRYDSSLTYNIGERVVLTNGDIVKSNIDDNTNDPNVNMTGWVKTNSTSQIFDESGLSQHEINADTASKINIANELYVSSYIKNLDGVADNTADFQSLISARDGKKLILKAGEIITLNTPVIITSNLFLSGDGKISINHAGVGITSSADVVINGNIVIDGNDTAQSAVITTNGNSICKIGGGVNINNFYSANQKVVAVQTVSQINIFDDLVFNRLRCVGNDIVGDSAGIVRCILIGGDSVTFINRLKVTNVNNVDIHGNNVIEDADAIQTQNGVQYLSLNNSEFTNVGKRWLKIQGYAGSKTVINNLKGSSSWVDTTDTIAEMNNGMFSPISVYAGSLTIDGIEFNGGAAQCFLNVAGNTVTQVSIDNVTYNPKYQNYAQGGITRFISGATAPSLDLTVGDNVTSTNTHEGVYINESVPFLQCKVGACEIKTKSTVIAGGYKLLDINGLRVTHTTPTASTVISVPTVTDTARINGLYVVGAYAYGVYIAGSRTTNLSGVITGVLAPQVSDTLRLIGGMTQYLKGLQICNNSGNGTIESAQSAAKHTLRSQNGATDYVVVDSTGLTFNFRVFTTANLQSAVHVVNTASKVVGSAVYDLTAKKLMVATGSAATATWASVDGVTTISPV